MEIKDFVLGHQHIGIPTKDLEKTISFYEGLGFKVTWRNDTVAFFAVNGFTIEAYVGDTNPTAGAIDHITLDVKDIEKVFQLAKQGGYTLIDNEIIDLPFFEKGVRYFMVEGPSKERVEFNEILK